jgi:hypothetical protein
MDFQKTKIYLDKLNREFARMNKDPENTVRLDVDIMASYVRELYDAVLSEAAPAAQVKAETPAARPAPRPPAVVAPVEVPPPPPPPPPAPPTVVAEAPPPAPREEPPAPAPPPPVVVEEPKPAPAHRASGASHGAYEVLFEEKQAKELSEKLAETPIADLKKAIALNDRLQYTSELFAGDGQAFERALAALNNASGFDEARAWMVENCVAYYTWTDKKRLETAKAFVKLVRRRHKGN